MQEQLIIAREFSVFYRGEEILTDSSFLIQRGSLITFSYSSHYALKLPQIFMNPGIYYQGIFRYQGKKVGKKNPISSCYISEGNLLMEDKSIFENIMTLQTGKRMFDLYYPRKMKKILSLYLMKNPLPFSMDLPVGTMTRAQKYILFLIRSVLNDYALILMDEIPEDITQAEFSWIQRFLEEGMERGRTFLYFTRSEGKIPAMSDYIYFIHFHRVNSMMLGEEYSGKEYRKALFYGHVRNIQKRECRANSDHISAVLNLDYVLADHCQLSVYQREILGILDLHGGFSTGVFRALEGNGICTIENEACTSYQDAVKKGLALISFHENDPLFQNFSFKENLSFQILPQISRGTIIDQKMENYLAGEYEKKFSHFSGTERDYSGRLQLLIYRWLMKKPKLMVFDNPFVMDIEDHFFMDFQKTMEEVLDKGTSILLLSNLPNTSLKICDRILIIKNYGEYRIFDMTSENEEDVQRYIKAW